MEPDAGAMNTMKVIALVNQCACMLWLTAAVWFQPELQISAKGYQLVPAASMFLGGLLLFFCTNAFNLFAAIRAGSAVPGIIKLCLAGFACGMTVAAVGLVGFLPSSSLGINAVRLCMSGFSVVLLVGLLLTFLTYMGCTGAGVSLWPVFPMVMFDISIALLVISCVLFHYVFEGQPYIYEACAVLQAAMYPLGLYGVGVVLFPMPSGPPPEKPSDTTNTFFA